MTSGHIRVAFYFLLESVLSVLKALESLKDLNKEMTQPGRH